MNTSNSITKTKYDKLILDLDGTVYLDSVPIGPVINYLNDFLSKGGEIFILTNNTSISRVYYQEKLAALGLNINLKNIISPVVVAGNFLQEEWGKQSRCFILGTNDLKMEFESKYRIVHCENNPGYVLVGFDKSLSYKKLQKACELINGGLPYYFTNIDIACPTRMGPIPDTGMIAKILEMVTGETPVKHFGKPGTLMKKHLISLIGDKKSALLAGDRLYTDIELGNKIGIDTLVVFSGETKLENLKTSTIQPTFSANTLADFLSCQFTLK